jgi:pimeloyl-ACP methyl ester carboxylesterase
MLCSVPSSDGVDIAVECGGKGPTLIIVHGGTGDRSRWTKLFPFFEADFRVCAMDRRGHGASSDSPRYSLQKEAQDVVAVIDSRPGPVFVLGHSFGGVAMLEAAFVSTKISKLVLYEPPLQEPNRAAIAETMEGMVRRHELESALLLFLQQMVMVSPAEIAAMKSRPSWPGLVASIGSQIRQLRALDEYHFDAQRIKSLRIPTLLLAGSDTASPALKQATKSLFDLLPDRRLAVLEGQQHNAMDTIPREFAEIVSRYLRDR